MFFMLRVYTNYELCIKCTKRICDFQKKELNLGVVSSPLTASYA